jgi:RNA polymerase sigma-70 factor (ECF subfamily)
LHVGDNILARHPLLPVQNAAEPHPKGIASPSQWDEARYFEAVYAIDQRRLLRVALGILKNQADAEDAVQESLLRAYTKIEIVRIVINTSLMSLRKRSGLCDVSLDCDGEDEHSWADRLPATGMSDEAVAIKRQSQDLMYTVIAGLPVVSKRLVSEWILREVTLTELSNPFEMSVPAVKLRMLRAREQVVLKVKRRM